MLTIESGSVADRKKAWTRTTEGGAPPPPPTTDGFISLPITEGNPGESSDPTTSKDAINIKKNSYVQGRLFTAD